ncbi:RdgB/HAM1 family non-canonical purine NTP pyrophosphatase [Candidatus Acetothermia bacterium]|nr:RdgB/HAM1 family non-canonical purine NTP pyrophosphatase [Candidatus Acetothermia bacterium]MBI3461244.1 RdgB/HAM1 family non-canonical purine NTP pyrophosphatase [Candidatus Acetothermia bacterium]MBI3660943.1 RdgB/HAM1 family non-canonical purine NTP pyrophosphatase [Candidatus Acetothermia bacterium]
MKILLATKNKNKIAEIRAIYQGIANLELLTVDEKPFSDVAEDGQTFRENALKKAKAICKETELAALAEDSGLEVEALGGQPGIYSARFAGEPTDDRKNNEKLLQRLKREPNRKARFHCSAVLALPDGREFLAEGTLEGRIASEPKGKSGFGYDPVFIPNGFSKTMAELGQETKDRISHRRRALERLRESLQTLCAGTNG